MERESQKLSRRDFLHLSGLSALALGINPDTLGPEKGFRAEGEIKNWPTISPEAIPQETLEILSRIPHASIDNSGNLNDESGKEALIIQTHWNKERTREADRLYPFWAGRKAPWAIVLHWSGNRGFSITPEEFVTGINDSVSIETGRSSENSAHFAAGIAPFDGNQKKDSPISIIQTQLAGKDGTPFLASHLKPINYKEYDEGGRRWYPVNALYGLQQTKYKENKNFFSSLQLIFDRQRFDPNLRTIAVEIAGWNFDSYVPEQTVANTVAITWALMKRYKIRAWDILGHWELDESKGDPGKKFLSEIRYLIGVKALLEEDEEMKKLVFGSFLNEEESNKKEAARKYFESVRDYLVLTSLPRDVAKWEEKTKFWFLINEVFEDSPNPALAERFILPLEGQLNDNGSRFLETMDNGGVHTGRDYNVGEVDGIYEEDFGLPIKLVANGKCVFSGKVGNALGKVAIFEHLLPTGQKVYTRFAHMDKVKVRKAKEYKMGEDVGTVGKSGGQRSAHLHFEIIYSSTYDRLFTAEPGYYPGGTSTPRLLEQVRLNFIDPDTIISS